MRRLVRLASLILSIAAPAAQAQSGVGTLRGVVLPIRAGNVGGFGDWYRRFDDATRAAPQSVRDSTPVARLVLTPVATLRPRRDVTPARGLYGRYTFGRISMGRYRLRVEADGCTPYETDIVILSDSESVQHIALTCAWATD